MTGNSVWAAEIHRKVGKHFAVHSGGAVGAGFFLVCKAGNRGIFRICRKNAGKLAISAYSVIVAVGTDKASVKADVARFAGRHHGKLCGLKVLFGDFIFLKEDVCDVKLYFFAYCVISERSGTDKNVQFFAADSVAELSVHLLLCKVRKKVGYTENRVVFVFAHIYGNGSPVLADDNAVKRKRNSSPLVSFNSAVIMRLEKSKFFVFIKRVGFKVKTRGINMCCRNVKTFFKWSATDFGKKKRLVAVVYVDFIAGNIFVTGFKRNKALLFKHGNAPVDKFTLGFACADKLFVVFTVVIGFGYLLFGKGKPAVLW